MQSTFAVSSIAACAVLGALLCIGANTTHAQDAGDAAGASLDIDRSGNRFDVRGLFVNRDGPSGTLRYDLRVQRTGSAGSMTSSQSGTFETAPNQTDTLSTVTVNASGGADLSITLEIRDGDGLVDTEQRERTVEPAPDG
jgi:hypothetical protein